MEGQPVSTEFKKLRQLLQRKRRIKIELCVRLSVLRLFDVGHVVQRKVKRTFAYIENERFTAAGSRCRQNPKHENFTSASW